MKHLLTLACVFAIATSLSFAQTGEGTTSTTTTKTTTTTKSKKHHKAGKKKGKQKSSIERTSTTAPK